MVDNQFHASPACMSIIQPLPRNVVTPTKNELERQNKKSDRSANDKYNFFPMLKTFYNSLQQIYFPFLLLL